MVITKKELTFRINEVLQKYQFYGHRTLWNRHFTNSIDVIDLQINKYRDMFTLNVGVADKFVAQACWGLDGTTMMDEPSCTVRVRLGELLHGTDTWWRIADEDGVEEVLSGIKNAAIPFLQFNHDIVHMIESLEKDPAASRYPPGIIYLALLYYRNGEFDSYKDMLRSMKLTGAWAKKASQIFDALN